MLGEILQNPPGQLRGLQPDVGNRDDFSERGLAHRADGVEARRRAARPIENRAVGRDFDADTKRIGAREPLSEERSDQRIVLVRAV